MRKKQYFVISTSNERDMEDLQVQLKNEPGSAGYVAPVILE
jgi:hypothetical protein